LNNVRTDDVNSFKNLLYQYKFKPRSSLGSSGLDVEVLQDLVVAWLGGIVNGNEGEYHADSKYPAKLSEYRRANHVDIGENNDAEKYCEHYKNG
jgi:hypothetical protein